MNVSRIGFKTKKTIPKLQTHIGSETKLKSSQRCKLKGIAEESSSDKTKQRKTIIEETKVEECYLSAEVGLARNCKDKS
jgi:hypothetical protein